MSRGPDQGNLLEVTSSVLHRLELLLQRLDAGQAQTDEMLTLMRGSINGVLLSGTFTIGSTPFGRGFAAPFSAVAFADPNGLGLTLSTAGMDGVSTGVGTVKAAPNDVACVPLIGRHLQVQASTPGAAFLAVYTRPQPFYWGKC